MAGPLKNHKHELFAQALAKGETADAAYAQAGYKPNDGNCIRLKGNERISARVEELLSAAAALTELTVADIARQLDEDRDFARKMESASAAVQATMGKAKVLGLIVEKTKTEITNPDGSLRPTVIRIVAADDRSGTAASS